MGWLWVVCILGCARGPEPAAKMAQAANPAGAEAPSAGQDPAVGATGPVGPTVPLTVGGMPILVEVADTEMERAKGLMHRDGLAQHHGMLFVYPDSELRGFWMKNTRIPLDIAFVDERGVVVHIAQMQPLSLKTSPSMEPAMYALEMAQGWMIANGVAVGSAVQGLPGASRE